jgi:phage shock protein PspC (stress-responsive transcriptional regulator)
MKTTITINLGGIVFHIDDDAYEMLHTYLMAVEKQFKSDDERREVMSDIEARLSELFSETLGQKRDVIMRDDVSKIVEIMGEPEDFIDEEAHNDSTNSSEKESRRRKSNQKTSKRLYRDPDTRMLGGVCGGLGAYFNIGPIIFRIIFILISFGMGSGIIIYVILWIVIPEASTTAQKLEMRGEPITIENIKKAVRDEFDNVRNNMKF